MMDILKSEKCWAHKNWNTIASDIKLVFHSSTITMMHGPINIRFKYTIFVQSTPNSCQISMKLKCIDRFSKNTQISIFTTIHSVGAELFNAYRQTDRQTKFTNRIVILRKRLETYVWALARSILFVHIAHLRQHYHHSKSVIFQERLLKVLKCYNFLWVQRRHNCFLAASFVNCVMTLYLWKVHLQTFLSIPKNQKCQTLSCDTLVANERYVNCFNTHILLLCLSLSLSLSLCTKYRRMDKPK